MSRVHARFLGLLAQPVSPPVNSPLTRSVHVHQRARATLQAQLAASGRWRGGLLFGHAEDDVLHVHFAAPQGYAWWPTCQTPLQVDPHYALGWADALAAASEQPVDWVGSWIMYPDSQLGGIEADLVWLHAGRTTALVDDLHLLMSVGWSDGRLSATAYRPMDGELETLEVEWLPAP
ncbi:hypothetical protein [Deinococcus aestuarii]|uniref:hypothetical protein n=1 Tax=Deinococcus aestuarii TaxID=2774531 RepID=UPI001C0E4DC4|nr:hypothetical protein [Deinococcus aestuarii]